MGAAPSAEILREAPFRPPQGGLRQIALIPIVPQYFPSPESELFTQLYEACTDPSVRYYMRENYEGGNVNLGQIPPITQTKSQMYRALLRSTTRGIFPSNAAIRAEVAAGRSYCVRPVQCAVVFLYEGANYVPEGSILLPKATDPRWATSAGGAAAVPSHGSHGGTSHHPHSSSGNTYVKVIGLIGDTSSLPLRDTEPLTPYHPDDVLHIRTLITKSAGDHNMSRVVLLAAYTYQTQCCERVGLSCIPAMASSFTCFKTNIPFLCFLREMRDRTETVLQPPDDDAMYIDEYCLRGEVKREYVAQMIPAFHKHFIQFLEQKAEQHLYKQQQQLRVMGGSRTSASARAVDGCPISRMADSLPNDMVIAPNSSGFSDIAGFSATTGSHQVSMTGLQPKVTKPLLHSSTPSTAPKITYALKGYITRPTTIISAWSLKPHEVYVVCADSVVQIVSQLTVDGANGPTHTPAIPPSTAGKGESRAEEEADELDVVETIRVRRGHILSFCPHKCTEESDDDSLNFNLSAFPATSPDEDAMVRPPIEILDVSETIIPGSPGTNSISWPQKGSWKVDRSIYIESVLLSLVRDECKLAREADEDDPRWVRDEKHQCPAHEGSFYVWHFRRGLEHFYYGTVPKFANPNRRDGGGSRTSHPMKKPAPTSNGLTDSVASRKTQPSANGCVMTGREGPCAPPPPGPLQPQSMHLQQQQYHQQGAISTPSRPDGGSGLPYMLPAGTSIPMQTHETAPGVLPYTSAPVGRPHGSYLVEGNLLNHNGAAPASYPDGYMPFLPSYQLPTATAGGAPGPISTRPVPHDAALLPQPLLAQQQKQQQQFQDPRHANLTSVAPSPISHLLNTATANNGVAAPSPNRTPPQQSTPQWTNGSISTSQHHLQHHSASPAPSSGSISFVLNAQGQLIPIAAPTATNPFQMQQMTLPHPSIPPPQVQMQMQQQVQPSLPQQQQQATYTMINGQLYLVQEMPPPAKWHSPSSSAAIPSMDKMAYLQSVPFTPSQPEQHQQQQYRHQQPMQVHMQQQQTQHLQVMQAPGIAGNDLHGALDFSAPTMQFWNGTSQHQQLQPPLPQPSSAALPSPSQTLANYYF